MKRKFKIGIIGVGMVGTPLKRYFEEKRGYKRGKNLFLYDIDARKGYNNDVNSADAIFVCLPTPRAKNGAADVSIVESVVKKIGGWKIVVIKSTVPPGTTESFQKKYPRHKFLFNPEFLTEVRAWEETISPSRQLVGWTKKSREEAPKVLSVLPRSPLCSPSKRLNLTATEAELVKYASNVFLTRKVTFANAIFDLAKHHGADYENIRIGIASDARIGHSHLNVHHNGYRGYGGFCFTKDTDALIAHCRSAGLSLPSKLFEADRIFNEAVLTEQGLTPEDVSVHDYEWIQKKLKFKNQK